MTTKTTDRPSAKTIGLQTGGIYCVSVPQQDNSVEQRILMYNGPDKPWDDVLSGERAFIDPESLDDATEVPGTVLEAFKTYHHKRTQAAAPRMELKDESVSDAWERDVYCDEWDD